MTAAATEATTRITIPETMATRTLVFGLASSSQVARAREASSTS
ncbi:MAG: hypothetical protein M5U28_00965 [Sandaracinaceae bacterium]|nr:hypothetical protein [Sandaracinaceae bacterium]